MSRNGRSDRDLFGSGYTHYDEHGKKIGRSEKNLFGGYTNYDEKGKKVGRSEENLFGGYTNYDARGHKTGSTQKTAFGSYQHYDAKGHSTGRSDPNLLGGGFQNNTSTGACYIATCVYNSYDCPQVWTLRRFRDQHLAKSIPGRGFIRSYYAISPGLVKWFGKRRWFRSFWKMHLDRMVERLQKKGFSDAPYQD